jgi:hypothetical protein
MPVANLARMACSKTWFGDKPLSIGSSRQSYPSDPAPFDRQPYARYYIKPQSADVIAAMGKFEAEIAAHHFRDSDGTVNQASGAMPKSVN